MPWITKSGLRPHFSFFYTKLRDEEDMVFIDLNLTNAELAGKAKASGFQQVFTPQVFSSPGDLSKSRNQTFAVFENSDCAKLRSACKREGVLVNPFLYQDFWRDIGLIREMAGSKNAFEIPIALFLQSSFVQRSKLLHQTSVFLRYCKKFRAQFAFTSRAQTEFDLKTPREFTAIGVCLGLTFEEAVSALSEVPQKFIEE